MYILSLYNNQSVVFLFFLLFLLCSIIGPAVITKFKEKKLEDYVDMFRDFELKKRTVGPDSDDKVTIRMPIALPTLVKDERHHSLEEIVKTTKHDGKVSAN